MTTQVIFRTDPKLKTKALKKLGMDGVTMKTLLNSCIKEYVNGKIRFGVSFVSDEPEMEIMEVTPDVQKEMDTLSDLVKKMHAAHQ